MDMLQTNPEIDHVIEEATQLAIKLKSVRKFSIVEKSTCIISYLAF